MSSTTPEADAGHEAFVLDSSAEMSAGVFPLGANMDCVDPQLRLRDRHRRLNLSGLLDATPLNWVHLGEYRVGRRMVTNGEYQEFLLAEDGFFDQAQIWKHVWHELGLMVKSHTRYDQGVDGKVIHREDSHEEARNFVEAYVDSLESEVRQWAEFEGAGDDGDGPSGLERIQAVTRVFAFVKQLLGSAIVEGGNDPVLLPEKEKLIAPFYTSDGGEAFKQDIETIKAFSIQRLEQLIPPGLRGRLRSKPAELVEGIALLERVRNEWVENNMPPSVALSRVLFPRTWEQPEGEKPMGFAAPQVPWKDRPVYGITLYEAAAYCAWLSSQTQWKWTVSLPNEAQYERAASWPEDPPKVTGGRLELDPREKDLFPWQKHCPRDFNDLFGQEQSALSLVWADPSRHAELVAQSCRNPGDNRIENLIGFGWQWCMERFDNAERRYARFRGNAQDPFTSVTVYDTLQKRVVPVFEYKVNRAPSHSFFVVRGAPEVLGGPGMTTRRFAMYPLRGYPNVGFRWVATPRS